MRFLKTTAAAAAMLALPLAAEDAETTFSAGFGASNAACGTGIPTAYVAYDRDSDDVEAHLHLSTGPSGSCGGQATSVDAQISKRHQLSGAFYVDIQGGYDWRTIPFEYEPAATKQFKGVGVETVTGAAAFGYDFGDWTLELVYNAIEHDFDAGGGVSPVSVSLSGQFGMFEIDADLMESSIGTLAVKWEGEKMEITGRASSNYHLLENPAPSQICKDFRDLRDRPGIKPGDVDAIVGFDCEDVSESVMLDVFGDVLPYREWVYQRQGGPKVVYGIDVGFKF